MTILPLPVFEEELKQLEDDKKTYAALKVPKTLVVRFGFMKMVGEFPYQGDLKPGCGSKIVVRTHRGVEIGEMLTSTCPNSGCSKSVSRKEMLEYIQNSGGRDYPFFEHGRALRVATPQDMEEQTRIEQSKHPMRLQAKAIGERLGFAAKIVEIEPILGGEQVAVYYNCEDRIDFRDLVTELQRVWKTRIEMRQVGARDEARLTADYERCGQHCCCKNFLKVLKPVSMRSAKVQKATLDPLKISGRCGRLMCCLRYEDSTYEDLRKRLPRNKSRVGTPEGDGMVIDSQILTQLVLVRLDVANQDIAVAVEDLTEAVSAVQPAPAVGPPMDRGRREGGPRREDRPRREETPRRDEKPRPEEPIQREVPEAGEDREAGPGGEAVEGRQQGEARGAGEDGAGGQTGSKREGRERRRDDARPSEPAGESGPPREESSRLQPRPEAGSGAAAPSRGRVENREGSPGAGEADFGMDDIETDFGDGPTGGGPGTASGPDGDRKRRKRKRRRRGGGNGGTPGGPAGAGGPPPPAPTGGPAGA